MKQTAINMNSEITEVEGDQGTKYLQFLLLLYSVNVKLPKFEIF